MDRSDDEHGFRWDREGLVAILPTGATLLASGAGIASTSAVFGTVLMALGGLMMTVVVVPFVTRRRKPVVRGPGFRQPDRDGFAHRVERDAQFLSDPDTRCPSCQSLVASNAAFCSECGRPLERRAQPSRAVAWSGEHVISNRGQSAFPPDSSWQNPTGNRAAMPMGGTVIGSHPEDGLQIASSIGGATARMFGSFGLLIVGWITMTSLLMWAEHNQPDLESAIPVVWGLSWIGLIPVSAAWIWYQLGWKWGMLAVLLWPFMFPIYIFRQARGSLRRRRGQLAERFPTMLSAGGWVGVGTIMLALSWIV